jgi:DNA-binding winged helix-turn-helix (wHTH) protein
MDHDGLSIVAPQKSPTLSGGATLEFGRFRVLPRERRLLAGGVPMELGGRAFDLLMVLIEADGALVTKDELQSRVWSDIIVAEGNLKVQIAALRKALGQDRGFVRTEHGRGYRFTAAVCDTISTPECWLARSASTPQNPQESGSQMDLPVIASRLARLEVQLAEVEELQGTHRDNGRRQRARYCVGHSGRRMRRRRPMNSAARGAALPKEPLDEAC